MNQNPQKPGKLNIPPQVKREPGSAFDGLGVPGMAYQKPATYRVSPLDEPRSIKPGVRTAMFNHYKQAEFSAHSIGKVSDYNQTRKGRRALRTILHARKQEAKAQAERAATLTRTIQEDMAKEPLSRFLAIHCQEANETPTLRLYDTGTGFVFLVVNRKDGAVSWLYV